MILGDARGVPETAGWQVFFLQQANWQDISSTIMLGYLEILETREDQSPQKAGLLQYFF